MPLIRMDHRKDTIRLTLPTCCPQHMDMSKQHQKQYINLQMEADMWQTNNNKFQRWESFKNGLFVLLSHKFHAGSIMIMMVISVVS